MSKYPPSLKNPSQSYGPGRQRRLSFFLWIRDCAIKSFHARGGLALAAAGLLPLSAGAADFTVDTLSDVSNATDGLTTLREAIVLANGNSEADTISFDDGLTGTLTLTQGQLVVSDDLTIEGPEADDLTISGNNSSRIFQFTGGTSELSRLTLSNGDAGEGFDGGGAILVGSLGGASTDLTVLNSKLSGNSGRDGGGISNYGTLTVLDSAFSGNDASYFGGGIFNSLPDSGGDGGTLSVVNSTFSGNSAEYGGGVSNGFFGTLSVLNSRFSGNSGRDGGGISNDAGSTLSVVNSTLSGNYSADDGGGIFNSVGSTLSVVNSTISGNSAEDDGGGIFNRVGSTLSVVNNTLSGNSGRDGGGISNFGELSLANSIVAANAAANGDANINGLITTNEGGNVFDTNIGGGSDTVETDLANIFDSLSNAPNTNVLSGALADNGGPVATILILEGGAAHNHQDAAALPEDSFDLDSDDDLTEALPVDSRGLPRMDGLLDAGAVELVQIPPQVFVVTTLDDTVDSTDGERSLREAITEANLTSTADIIRFDDELTGILTLTQGQVVVSDDLTIEGPEAGDLTISGNNSSRIFEFTGGTSELSRLTLSDGNAGFGAGGAILVGFGADLTVLKSTFSGNSARSGGGIANDGTLSVLNSTLSGNDATLLGGGIFNDGILSVLNSTLSGNSALRNGGGIANDGTLSMLNSTLSGNSALYDGGGIYNQGTLSMLNSTLSGNSALYDGGGIYNQGALSLANSIVAANAATSNADIGGTIDTNLGGNVFGTNNIGGGDDIIEINPANIFESLSDFTDSDGNVFQGGSLADNGGPVETILILEEGVAHNHQVAAALPADTFDLDGDDDLTEVLPVDARGLPRVRGALDSGALELNIVDLVEPVLNAPIFDQAGNPVVSFSFDPDVSGALWTLKRSTTLEDFDTVAPIFSYDGDDEIDTVGSLIFSLDSSSNTISVTDDTSPTDPKAFYRLEVENSSN